MCPSKIHIEVLIPRVMVFGGKACERLLGLDEIMRVGPHDGIRVPIEEDGTGVHSLPCKNIVRRQLSCPKPGKELSPGKKSTSRVSISR